MIFNSRLHPSHYWSWCKVLPVVRPKLFSRRLSVDVLACFPNCFTYFFNVTNTEIAVSHKVALFQTCVRAEDCPSVVHLRIVGHFTLPGRLPCRMTLTFLKLMSVAPCLQSCKSTHTMHKIARNNPCTNLFVCFFLPNLYQRFLFGYSADHHTNTLFLRHVVGHCTRQLTIPWFTESVQLCPVSVLG